MKKGLFIIMLLAVAFTLGTKAYAKSPTHRDWGKWIEVGKWSECKTEATCGVSEGVKERQAFRECVGVPGWGKDECRPGEKEWKTVKESCEVQLPECDVYGCTDEEATNYDPEATKDDESCTYEEEPEEPETPTYERKVENTFHKDTRCHAVKPEAPQWAIKSPAEGGILATWSAMGGSEVEIMVNNANGEWEYSYGISSNDGHEYLKNVGMSQLYKIRVINDCSKGDWLIDP